MPSHLSLLKCLKLWEGNRKALDLSKERRYLKINILKSWHNGAISLVSGCFKSRYVAKFGPIICRRKSAGRE